MHSIACCIGKQHIFELELLKHLSAEATEHLRRSTCHSTCPLTYQPFHNISSCSHITHVKLDENVLVLTNQDIPDVPYLENRFGWLVVGNAIVSREDTCAERFCVLMQSLHTVRHLCYQQITCAIQQLGRTSSVIGDLI